jgi:hypothetical protein
MSSLRRVPLVAVLAAGLAATGAAATLNHASNPSSQPSVLAASNGIESTALYCTGLTSAKYGAVGHVTLINTTDQSRQVSVNATSDTGQKWTEQLKIAGHSSQSVNPSQRLSGGSFGLTALVSGGGVIGVESTSARASAAPCVTTGEKVWYAAGFDTTVGSNAALSIYNPTATPAVLNVTTYSSSGFNAPAPFQGLSIGPHAQVRLDLGTQIVATANVGVRVNVLRGVVAIVGIQRSGSRTSFNSGLLGEVTSALFPRVTTANNAVAQIRVANPNPMAAEVTLRVTLSQFKVAPRVMTVPAYASELLKITPNSAIPAAGYASVQLSSTEPVIVALAAGTDGGIALSSPGAVSSTFVINDLYGQGYDAAALTNNSAHSITIEAVILKGSGQSTTHESATLAANSTQDFKTLFNQDLRAKTVLLSASAPVLQVTLTLPTSPIGTTLIEPLDGR